MPGAGRAAAAPRRTDVAEASAWVVMVMVGLVASTLAVRAGFKIGVNAAPFTADYRVKVEAGSVLAPALVVAVLAGIRAGAVRRLSWRQLLLAAYVVALGWSVALAVVDGGNGLSSPVAAPQEYLRDVHYVDDVGVLPFVRDFTSHLPPHGTGFTIATRTHPPGPPLLLWVLVRAGIRRPFALGLVLTALGCLAVPLVAVAARSVCGEQAARTLLPFVALAPYAVWIAVSMDAVVASLCAAFVACGVIASEPGRRARWALAGGGLLGVAALFSYAAPWLALIPLLVCFTRRRASRILLFGAGAVVPLGIARAVGFVWPDGLSGAQADWSIRVGPHRSWLVWAVLDLVVLVVACGPAVVAAARRVRETPGWAFVVGSGVAVAFAIGSGLARGEVERSWLPFFPWLLVPVSAPRRHPEVAGDEGLTDATPAPSLLLLAIGAVAAVLIESVLRTAW
ncbi:MAG: hypothetical protein LC640_09635 [Frankia sp.]|nr:hypothetical protein [Frankia sp.]